MNENIKNFLKGIAIGTANVIPGVSGGTIAVITGIFERLINVIKSFDLKAIKLLFSGKIKEFFDYIDYKFIISLGLGVGVAIVSLAKLLEYLFKYYPVYIWAYFFGLILVSVYYVGKTIEKWNVRIIIFFLAGTFIAISLSFLNPAVENSNIFYVFLCGVISICSMILPGISGSFVLILMGNYELVVVKAINNLDLSILIPFALGAVIGLIGFAHILSLILKKFRNETLGVLTGFILGSLLIIWPWKKPIYKLDSLGHVLLKHGEPVIYKYDRFIPQINKEFFFAIFFMILGAITIWLLETIANKKN